MKKLIFFISISLLISTFLVKCDKKPSEPETTGSITGKIIDQNGNMLSGVLVTTTPKTSSIITDSDGTYSFNDLEPCEYSIWAHKEGYTDASYTVEVKPGKTSRADMILKKIGPILSVNPKSINFGTSETSATISIQNSGFETLNWTISGGADWLTIDPKSGSTKNEIDNISLSVNRNGLAYDFYSTSIKISSNGGEEVVDILMTVPDPNQPQLSVSNSILNFGTSENIKTLYILNTGNGVLSWNITKDKDWITLNTKHDTTSAGNQSEIKVTVNRLGKSPGIYEGYLNITSNGGSFSVTVKMQIPEQPMLNVDVSELNFESSTTHLSFNIYNVGTGDLNWTITANQEWISVYPGEGKNDATINVSVDRTNLNGGSYSGVINISSNGGNAQITVNMQVPEDEPPAPVVLNNPNDITENSMKLTWTKNADDDFASYKLYRSKEAGVTLNSTLVTTINNNNTTQFTDTGLKSGTTYYYKVYVFDAGGKYSASNQVSGKTKTQLGSWVIAPNETGKTFKKLYFVSENEGYAFGNDGVAAKWNGSKWELFNLELQSYNEGIDDIFWDKDEHIYLVFSNGYNSDIFFYNNGQWLKFNVNPSIIKGAKCIEYFNNNDIWLGFYGKVKYYNGTEWTAIDLQAESIVDLYFTAQDNGYALDNYGRIYHWDGVGWKQMVELPYYNNRAYAYRIFGFNASNIWVYGEEVYDSNDDDNYPYNHFYHFDGNNWIDYGTNTRKYLNINGHYALSNSEIWFVGGYYDDKSIIYYYDGQQFNSVNSPVTKELYDVFMLSPNSGWAVGYDGTILRYH